MTSLRRRLRLWAVVWLAFQAASLSAFVPRDCCAVHQSSAASTKRVRPQQAARHCPMPAGDATVCPMHRKEPLPADTCRMRGTCGDPVGPLAVLLWQHGVLAERIPVAPDPDTAAPLSREHRSAAGRTVAPDSPPPRV